jgi:hypothetical protein
MAYEIQVTVLRTADGRVIGASFVAGAESYSEDFVERFPRSLWKGEATISINGDRIVLNGPTYNGRGEFEFRPNPDDLEGLKASIFADGEKKPTIEPAGVMTPGFQIVMKD